MTIGKLGLLAAGTTTNIANIDETNHEQKGYKEFACYLVEALQDVNRLQQEAQQASLKLAAGKVQDISEVVVAAEKATIALQLTVQIRNKVVDAYQEVMRMQV